MDFLQRVVERKKAEVARKKARRSADELRRLVDATQRRDFGAAVSGRGRIIAEVKKRSPRVARFRQGKVDTLAPLYARCGASAVSVVTDAEHFGTSLPDARRIREQMPLPILVKDFFIDPYQLIEARVYGADAVLLITRILPSGDLDSLYHLSGQLGMKALFEVHTIEDIGRAIAAGADIIGINNRDLDTLEVSIETTKKLIGHIPAGITIVSESGIRRRHEIEELSDLGVNAFLIGGALLESADPGGLLGDLLGQAPRRIQ